jgi:hypothetical protein
MFRFTAYIAVAIAKWRAIQTSFATLAARAVSCAGAFNQLAACLGDLWICDPNW